MFGLPWGDVFVAGGFRVSHVRPRGVFKGRLQELQLVPSWQLLQRQRVILHSVSQWNVVGEFQIFWV